MTDEFDKLWEKALQQKQLFESLGIPVTCEEVRAHRAAVAGLVSAEEVEAGLNYAMSRLNAETSPPKAPALAEQAAELAAAAWQWVGNKCSIFLNSCIPWQPAPEGLLDHLDEPACEGKNIPLPAAIIDELPWLDALHVVVIGPGRRSPETRRYKAEVGVREDHRGTGGALRIALAQKDGLRRNGIVTVAETIVLFKADFSADWSELALELTAGAET